MFVRGFFEIPEERILLKYSIESTYATKIFIFHVLRNQKNVTYYSYDISPRLLSEVARNHGYKLENFEIRTDYPPRPSYGGWTVIDGIHEIILRDGVDYTLNVLSKNMDRTWITVNKLLIGQKPLNILESRIENVYEITYDDNIERYILRVDKNTKPLSNLKYPFTLTGEGLLVIGAERI
ncbi:hypothetical protein DRO02_05930 [archaeon]|nr:MAG: hypothetical protein DRO21_05735 [archaeon]RLG63775.1 MAG: hypothetical protein DRO02_05930 [archaeon]RLG66309.1 MAG: hypothetical protein DRN89_01215 [archaeon]